MTDNHTVEARSKTIHDLLIQSSRTTLELIPICLIWPRAGVKLVVMPLFRPRHAWPLATPRITPVILKRAPWKKLVQLEVRITPSPSIPLDVSDVDVSQDGPKERTQQAVCGRKQRENHAHAEEVEGK